MAAAPPLMGRELAAPGRARLRELREQAQAIRAHVLRAVANAQAGHVGGPLSAAEMLATLYWYALRIDPQRPRWEGRDRFVLSKGHSAIGLYSALALRGYFPSDELLTFDHLGSRLQGHPDMTALEGLDMSTGSLGQGFSAAVGMAMAGRLGGHDFHVWAMVGDGECQEGQVWEAAYAAARYHLSNLTVLLDHNQLQQFGFTNAPQEVVPRHDPLPPNPGRLWEAWGWDVQEVDGHDVAALAGAARRALAARASGRPRVVIAATHKGAGVSFMSDDFNWHAKPPNADELAAALTELGHTELIPG